MQTTRIRIGDALAAKGLISDQQLQIALAEQKRAHRPLGEILISLGFVRSDQIAAVVADGLGVALLSASEIEPDPVLVAALDPSFVRSTQAFPLALENGALRVAMVDPTDPEMVSAVRQVFPYPLEISMVTDGDLALLVRKHLMGGQGEVASILSGAAGQDDVEIDDFPVEDVAMAVLVDGVNRGATDIHIQPEEKITRVRYRIDGVLQNGESLPRPVTEAILSRLKILSRLDIAERRRPQDGRLRAEIDGRTVDMRVSLMPTVHGENMVLRVLDRPGGAPRLGALGVESGHQGILKHVTTSPHGLFLVTGPTGSGKTTTLYAMLGEVDAIHRNVSTIEDPVEYQMPLVRQSQVEPAAGYDFHDGLRALLRQDPDVVLIGEIRDEVTANMAIKASMTGHLVFSTLHTNSAIGAVPRLVDLGIPAYLIEDALIGVLGQRLVRKVCDNCAGPRDPDPEMASWLGGDIGAPRKGAGCEHCANTGLSGRTVICEIFLPSTAMSEAMRGGGDGATLAGIARSEGFESMEENGKHKVRQGVTTMEEVLRVSRSHRMNAGDH